MKRNAIGYSFILPNFIGYFIFIFVPVILTFVLCVMKWDGSSAPMEFVGLKNFMKLFRDSGFRISVSNTLFYAVFTVPLTWNMLFQPEFGPVNEFLKFIGIANPPKWCASTDWAMTVIIIVSVWKYMGYYMVVYLAALQGISQDLYEAAGIDGATGFKKFRYITIPMLKPTTFFVIIMMTIQCFKVFDLIYVMTGGGPGRSTNVLVNHIYNAAFVDFKFGYASAGALVLFAIVLVVTLVQFQGEKKFTDYV